MQCWVSEFASIRIMKSTPDQYQSQKSGPESHHFDQRPNLKSLTGGGGDKVDYAIRLSTLSPSQGLWIWLQMRNTAYLVNYRRAKLNWDPVPSQSVKSHAVDFKTTTTLLWTLFHRYWWLVTVCFLSLYLYCICIPGHTQWLSMLENPTDKSLNHHIYFGKYLHRRKYTTEDFLLKSFNVFVIFILFSFSLKKLIWPMRVI